MSSGGGGGESSSLSDLIQKNQDKQAALNVETDAMKSERKIKNMIDKGAAVRLTVPGMDQTLLTSGYGGTLLTQRK